MLNLLQNDGGGGFWISTTTRAVCKGLFLDQIDLDLA